MLKKHIDACVDACLQDLQNSKDKKIKKVMEKVNKELPASLGEVGLHAMIKDIMCIIINEELDDEKIEKEAIVLCLESFINEIIKMKTIYTFKVSLNGLEKEVWRTIRLSSANTLADLGYFILAAFQADASHLFEFEIKKEKFVCETQIDLSDDEEFEIASDYSIQELSLKKKSKFSFSYDYGDNFDFSVTIQDIQVENEYDPTTTKIVTGGNGYGIWEDAHYEMSLYYEDEKKFNDFLKENNLERDEYPVDEIFDLEQCDESIRENLFAIKYAYEIGEDMEEELGQFLM